MRVTSSVGQLVLGGGGEAGQTGIQQQGAEKERPGAQRAEQQPRVGTCTAPDQSANHFKSRVHLLQSSPAVAPTSQRRSGLDVFGPLGRLAMFGLR